MRFTIILKADKNTEAGVLPNERLLTAMGNYNEELVKAGIMLAGEGLQPSSKGARVKFSGDKRTVVDGSFAETKDTRAAKRSKSRFARSSRSGISAPNSLRSFGRRKSGCGRSRPSSSSPWKRAPRQNGNPRGLPFP